MVQRAAGGAFASWKEYAEEGMASKGKIASGLSRFLHRSLAVGWSQWAWYANANNGLNALLYKMLVRVVVALFQRWVELQRLKQQQWNQ